MEAEYVLVVAYENFGPRVYGSFESVEQAHEFAARYRETRKLPLEAEAWTKAGWLFAIVELELG
jgi:hypothetical protein